MSHMSCVTCYVTPVTCHLSLTPTATDGDPLLTTQLCTVDWVAKNPNFITHEKFKHK